MIVKIRFPLAMFRRTLEAASVMDNVPHVCRIRS